MEIDIDRGSFDNKKIEYPRLMELIDDTAYELIVLFTSSNCGLVVRDSDAPARIRFEDGWVSAEDTSYWRPFTGKIIIKN